MYSLRGDKPPRGRTEKTEKEQGWPSFNRRTNLNLTYTILPSSMKYEFFFYLILRKLKRSLAMVSLTVIFHKEYKPVLILKFLT